jgi:hypothetical protein
VSLDTSGQQSNPRDKVYLDSAYVTIQWNSSGPWVAVKWKAWANSLDWRAAHETTLVALREHRASRILIDVRDARVIPEEDQAWVVENWIPRAIGAGRRWTAIVMPKSALMMTIVENIDKRQGDAHASGVKYFATPDEAEAWLSTVS